MWVRITTDVRRDVAAIPQVMTIAAHAAPIPPVSRPWAKSQAISDNSLACLGLTDLSTLRYVANRSAESAGQHRGAQSER
jgi:hypothetical protein